MPTKYLRNVSQGKVNISVAGKDLSSQLISFSLAHTKINESGLIFGEGEATFQAEPTDPLRAIDDRTGNFPRGSGCQIDVRFADQTTEQGDTYKAALPMNIMRVRESSYTIKGRVLTIQLCCSLTLLDQAEPTSNKAKVCLGKPRKITDIIREIMNSVNGPYLVDEIPGYIIEPLQGNSAVQMCGALAFSAGYFLYMDASDSFIRAAKYNFQPTGGRVYSSFYLVDYEAVSGGGTPPSKVIVEGSVSTVKNKELDNEFYEYSYGFDRQSEIRSTFDGHKKITETKVWEHANKLMPWLTNTPSFLLSEYRTEEYIYQDRDLTAKKKGEDEEEDSQQEEKCDEIEKVLVKKIVRSLRPFGVSLGEWVRLHELDNNRNIVFTNLFGEKAVLIINYYSPIEDYYEETNYRYNYFSLNEESEELNLAAQEIVSFKREPQGKIFPKAFKRTASEISDPVFSVTSEEKSSKWYKVGSKWARREVLLQSLAQYRQELAESLFVADEKNWIISKNSYTRPITVEDKTTISATESQPPAPETAPTTYEISEDEKSFKFEIESRLSSTLRTPPKTYRIEYPIGRSEESFDLDDEGELKGIGEFEAQAKAIANIIIALEWGRYKPVKLTDEILKISYRPMLGFGTKDPEGSYSYIMDGYSVAGTPTRVVSGWEGLFIG